MDKNNPRNYNYSILAKLDDFDHDKLLSNPFNYLFVPEDSQELQYLYMCAELNDEMRKKSIQQFSEVVKEYDTIIKIAAEFIKKLGLKDNYTSYYVIFNYLLWNGFFSKDMKFSYTKNNSLTLSDLVDLDVIAGKGNCLVISSTLNRISQQLGFDSHFLINSFRTERRDYILHIDRRDENGLLLPQRLTDVLYDTSVDAVGNHASVLVQDNGHFYVYDSTNLSVYKVDDTLIASLYNGIGECYLKPWGFFMYENMKQLEVLKLLCSISCQNPNSFMSDLEIQEIMDESLNICRNSKSLILDFRSQIQGSIEEINSNFFHGK